MTTSNTSDDEFHALMASMAEPPILGVTFGNAPTDMILDDDGKMQVLPHETPPVHILPAPPHFLGGSWDETKVVKERFKRLSDAPWKVVDVETSGKTPYSVPLRTKEKEAGRLRCRIISASWMNTDGALESGAWDLDTMTLAERGQLAKSCLSNTFVAHNALFDLSWLMHTVKLAGISTEKLWPKQVYCTLLLGRQLFPENRMELRKAAMRAGDPRMPWIKARLLADRGKENWGASLADFVYSLNLPWASTLDKSYQKPANWVLPAPLSPGHYRYVQDDATLPAVVIHRLLTDKAVPLESTTTQDEMVLDAAKFMNQYIQEFETDPRMDFYRKVSMPAIKRLCDISAKGMPWDHRGALYYRQNQVANLEKSVNTINEGDYPHLMPFKEMLNDPSEGLTQAVQDAWVATFKAYDPEVKLPRTGAGQYSLSAKDLRRLHINRGAAKPVYDLLSGIQKAKQSVKMIDNLEQFSLRAVTLHGGDALKDVHDRDVCRLHPMLGFGPGTDRLSSNDPNAQNLPGDPNFRALVRARPGHKIISADYGQIELRIAAGLSLRAQDEINQMLVNPDWEEPTELGKKVVKLLRDRMSVTDVDRLEVDLVKRLEAEAFWDNALKAKTAEFNRDEPPDPGVGAFPDARPDGTPMPDQYQDIKDQRDLNRLCIHAVRVRLNQLKHGEVLTGQLATAFREGIDPHLFTGLAMAQRQGKDIGGPDPLTVIRAAKKAGKVDELKDTFKGPRKAAKAVNFGLLYGMTSPTLHTTGVVTYGLDWALEDASMAHDAWFGLYPEIGLWQYWTILRPMWQGNAMVCKVNMRQGTAEVKKKELRSWKSTSLYGREYVREGFREALNYPDQGTGAHMILRAMNLMPKTLQNFLIDQIHDEILAEVPDELAEQARKNIEKAMIAAGNEALSKYNIPVEVDAEMGDVWLHGDAPDAIPEDFMPEEDWGIHVQMDDMGGY